jgi:glyoxylase-like metal-dependent hydrolase (beta-lactamase superfamily II)
MARIQVSLGFLVITLSAAGLYAQPQAAAIGVQQIRGPFYLVTGGSGANAAFVVGKTGVTVIDAKMSDDSAKTTLAEIAKITPNPVRQIVLTHSDGDHVNGLSGFPKGIPILAHANSKKDMEEAFKDPKMSALAAYLPTETITGNRILDAGGVRVELLHFGPAHTSGDLVVFLPEQKLAFAGDLLFVGRDPLIHRQKGGSSIGLAQTLNKMLEMDADLFLSGHNNPLGKAEIKTLLTSIEEKQAKVRSLAQQGRSLDEIKQAMGVAAAPGGGGPRFPSLVEIIYQEITAK